MAKLTLTSSKRYEMLISVLISSCSFFMLRESPSFEVYYPETPSQRRATTSSYLPEGLFVIQSCIPAMILAPTGVDDESYCHLVRVLCAKMATGCFGQVVIALVAGAWAPRRQLYEKSRPAVGDSGLWSLFLRFAHRRSQCFSMVWYSS